MSKWHKGAIFSEGTGLWGWVEGPKIPLKGPKSSKSCQEIGRLIFSIPKLLSRSQNLILYYVYNNNLHINNPLGIIQRYVLMDVFKFPILISSAPHNMWKFHISSTPWKSTIHILVHTNLIWYFLRFNKRKIIERYHVRMCFFVHISITEIRPGVPGKGKNIHKRKIWNPRRVKNASTSRNLWKLFQKLSHIVDDECTGTIELVVFFWVNIGWDKLISIS